MKRALVVHHIAHEGLAAFAGPLVDAGYTIERLDVGDPGFAEADFLAPDLLVLLGGPMAVYRPDLFPWLDGELARLAERLAGRRATLGICLGAQLIAAALGATVTRGPLREVGFAPLTLTAEGLASPLIALEAVPVLHWHGDGFAVPDEAVLLASTAHFSQAFAVGSTVLALQCHPEMGLSDDGLEDWLAIDAAYVAKAGTSADILRQEQGRWGSAAAGAGQIMLRNWLAGFS